MRDNVALWPDERTWTGDHKIWFMQRLDGIPGFGQASRSSLRRRRGSVEAWKHGSPHLFGRYQERETNGSSPSPGPPRHEAVTA